MCLPCFGNISSQRELQCLLQQHKPDPALQLPLPLQPQRTAKELVLTPQSWFHIEMTFTGNSSVCVCLFGIISVKAYLKNSTRKICSLLSFQKVEVVLLMLSGTDRSNHLLCPLSLPRILTIFRASSALGGVPPWELRVAWVFPWQRRDAKKPCPLCPQWERSGQPGETGAEALQQAFLALEQEASRYGS